MKKTERIPKFVIAANLPRQEIVSLMTQMNASKKLNGLLFGNIVEIIDERYYTQKGDG